MNCRHCQELFSLYFDKEIDQQSRSLLKAHIEACRHCKMEWQAFSSTVEFLHNIPMQKVPPGFLAGIHAKLEQQTRWSRMKGWVIGTGERKVAMSTAFAMLVVGFATASLMQVLPVTQSGNESGDQTASLSIKSPATQQAPMMVADNTTVGNDENQAYYPGIPMLSEYEGKAKTSLDQFAMVPRRQAEPRTPAVNFVSTSTSNMSSSYLNEPLSSLSRRDQVPVIKPDLQITIHTSANDEHVETIRQIMHSPHWRTSIYNNDTLLLSVPAGNFDILHQICCTRKTSFSPDYVRTSRFLSPKRLLTVAVKLD